MNNIQVPLRVDEILLARLDLWRRQQPNPPARPTAIRLILDQTLPHLPSKPNTKTIVPASR